MNWLRRILSSSSPSAAVADRTVRLFFDVDDAASERSNRVQSALKPVLLADLTSIVIGYAIDSRQFSWSATAASWSTPAANAWKSADDAEPPVRTNGAVAVCHTLSTSCWFRMIAAEPIDDRRHRWRIRTEFTAGKSGYIGIGISCDRPGCCLLFGPYWNDIGTKTDVMVSINRWIGKSGGRPDDAQVFHAGQYRTVDVRKSIDQTIVAVIDVDRSNRTFVVGFRGADGLLKQIEVRLPTTVPSSAVWRPAITFADDVTATILAWPDDVNLPTANRVQAADFF